MVMQSSILEGTMSNIFKKFTGRFKLVGKIVNCIELGYKYRFAGMSYDVVV